MIAQRRRFVADLFWFEPRLMLAEALAVRFPCIAREMGGIREMISLNEGAGRSHVKILTEQSRCRGRIFGRLAARSG